MSCMYTHGHFITLVAAANRESNLCHQHTSVVVYTTVMHYKSMKTSESHRAYLVQSVSIACHVAIAWFLK